MTPQQVHDQRDALQLVDVREAAELAEVRVPGAHHLPMGQVTQRLGELDRTRPVAVLCRSGSRSAQVVAYLTSVGIDAHDVEGGIQQWVRSGLPVQL